MDDFEKEMKVCFLDEAAQLLEAAEQNFMALESSSDDIKVVENLFRLAHNLKGGARAVGFSEMAEFTHVLESLLLKLKNKEIQVQSHTVSLLLECNDHLRGSIESLRGDFDFKMESSSILEKLQAQIEGKLERAESSTNQNLETLPNEALSKSEVIEMPAASPTTEAVGSGDAAVLFEAAHQFEEKEESVIPSPAAFVEEPANVPIVESVEPVKIGAVVSPSVPAEVPASEAQKKAPIVTEDESIRVSLRRLEGLINNVGELVILQTVLNQQKYHIQSPLIHRTVGQLAKITKDIQDISMSLRMVPLKQILRPEKILRDN